MLSFFSFSFIPIYKECKHIFFYIFCLFFWNSMLQGLENIMWRMHQIMIFVLKGMEQWWTKERRTKKMVIVTQVTVKFPLSLQSSVFFPTSFPSYKTRVFSVLFFSFSLQTNENGEKMDRLKQSTNVQAIHYCRVNIAFNMLLYDLKLTNTATLVAENEHKMHSFKIRYIF